MYDAYSNDYKGPRLTQSDLIKAEAPDIAGSLLDCLNTNTIIGVNSSVGSCDVI